jgi:hypothetical protein
MGDEKCVLVTLAHQNQTIKSVFPAFRILGFFEDMDEAVSFAKKHNEQLKEFSVFIYLLSQPFPICVSVKNQSDPEYIKLKVDSIIEAHKKKIDSCKQQFIDDVSKKQIGPVFQSDYVKRLKYKHENKGELESTKKILTEQFRTLPDCPMLQEKKINRPGKPFAGISVISERDAASQGNEVRVGFYRTPVVIVWKDFATEKDAEDFGKNPAHTEVAKYPYYCVSWKSDLCHDWLFPDDIDLEALKEIYRNSKLNEYMDYRKKEKLDIKAYEEFCKQNQVKALENVIGDDPEDVKRAGEAKSTVEDEKEKKRTVNIAAIVDKDGLQQLKNVTDSAVVQEKSTNPSEREKQTKN